MIAESPCPVIGLDNGIPDKGILLYNERLGKYGCCHDNDIGCLAYFADVEHANAFAELIDVPMSTIEKTLDEALDIAKSRPPDIVCVAFVENWTDRDYPKMFVR